MLHQHLFDTGCFLVSISESHCSMLITVQCTFSIFMMSFFLYRSVPDSTGVFKVGTNKNQVSLITSTHYKNIIYVHKGYRIEYIFIKDTTVTSARILELKYGQTKIIGAIIRR